MGRATPSRSEINSTIHLHCECPHMGVSCASPRLPSSVPTCMLLLHEEGRVPRLSADRGPLEPTPSKPLSCHGLTGAQAKSRGSARGHGWGQVWEKPPRKAGRGTPTLRPAHARPPPGKQRLDPTPSPCSSIKRRVCVLPTWWEGPGPPSPPALSLGERRGCFI